MPQHDRKKGRKKKKKKKATEKQTNKQNQVVSLHFSTAFLSLIACLIICNILLTNDLFTVCLLWSGHKLSEEKELSLIYCCPLLRAQNRVAHNRPNKYLLKINKIFIGWMKEFRSFIITHLLQTMIVIKFWFTPLTFF